MLFCFSLLHIYIFVPNCTISKNLLASEWSENAWRRKKIREIREKGLKTLFHRFISLGGLCCRVFSRNFSPSFPLLRRKVLVRFLRGEGRRRKKGFSSSWIRRKFREGKHAIRSISLSELGIPSGIPLPPRFKDFKNRSPNESIFSFFFFSFFRKIWCHRPSLLGLISPSRDFIVAFVGAFIDESLVHSRIKENSTAKGGFGMIKIFHKKFSIKSSRKSAQDDFEHFKRMNVVSK